MSTLTNINTTQQRLGISVSGPVTPTADTVRITAVADGNEILVWDMSVDQLLHIAARYAGWRKAHLGLSQFQ